MQRHARRSSHKRRGTPVIRIGSNELTLRAPFGGLIAAVNIKPGEYVTPDTPLITIGDPGAWQIETTGSTVTTTRQGSRCDPWRASNLAGRAGFEPARGCYPLRHFQCRALGHYATSPCIHLDNRRPLHASRLRHGACDRRKESCCNLSATLNCILYTIPATMLQYGIWLVTSCVSLRTATSRPVG